MNARRAYAAGLTEREYHAKQPNGIELSRDANGEWYVKLSGPHRQETVDLFGTDTLITGFTRNATEDRVLTAIRGLNPGVVVTVKR